MDAMGIMKSVFLIWLFIPATVSTFAREMSRGTGAKAKEPLKLPFYCQADNVLYRAFYGRYGKAAWAADPVSAGLRVLIFPDDDPEKTKLMEQSEKKKLRLYIECHSTLFGIRHRAKHGCQSGSLTFLK